MCSDLTSAEKPQLRFSKLSMVLWWKTAFNVTPSWNELESVQFQVCFKSFPYARKQNTLHTRAQAYINVHSNTKNKHLSSNLLEPGTTSAAINGDDNEFTSDAICITSCSSASTQTIILCSCEKKGGKILHWALFWVYAHKFLVIQHVPRCLEHRTWTAEICWLPSHSLCRTRHTSKAAYGLHMETKGQTHPHLLAQTSTERAHMHG